MKRQANCGSAAHEIARRHFLGLLGAGTAGLGLLGANRVLGGLKEQNRRVLVVFLHGGVSQLETWDPKPMTKTGGPFRAIPTKVPGIHISELLPKTAQHMDKLALIRGLNTHNNDHSKGYYQMRHGRDRMPGLDFPHLGAVTARGLERPQSPLPGFIRVPSGGRGSDAAYLGPRYGSIGVNGKPPVNSSRPATLTEAADLARREFRRRADERFARNRHSGPFATDSGKAETGIYAESYDQALRLMAKRDVFDLSHEPQRDHERYGKHDFGQHCLLARRLLENDVPFVEVTHRNYDTHNENFSFHLEQLGEFDTPFSCLVQDLHERGLLESTLVVVMSEFGRTPKINVRYGRDHWGKSWSICLGGAGIAPGTVVGKTNETGMEVVDREVDHGELFHTYLQAVGLDSHSSFTIGGRDFPLADPAKSPIKEVLS
ncbi:hypothetical protein Pan216_10740 [Planctomycetes bacterium Pan216]|uniref:Sulfatase n=1 Tax=Kolteria novifilia TaxID=2527975 RepID=A0A518AZU1_9BACT|nr:hypothetical protein Pan216_10740 [Planctomycetes bacterium Pan216]